MLIITKRWMIDAIAERWRQQYLFDGSWNHGDDKEKKYILLLALNGSVTEEDVSRIIGNDTWTKNVCKECGVDSDLVIQLGKPMDYDSSTTQVCRLCLIKALAEIYASPAT